MQHSTYYPYQSARPSGRLLTAVLTLLALALIIGVGVHLTKADPEPVLTDAEVCYLLTPTYDEQLECVIRQAG